MISSSSARRIAPRVMSRVITSPRATCSKRLGDGFEIAGQGTGHQLAGLAGLFMKSVVPAGLAHSEQSTASPAGSALQQRHLVHELVAGGAVHAPVVVMQSLATGEIFRRIGT